MRLLGHMLLAWSEASNDRDDLTAALAAAEDIEAPDDLRAHLHAKVATFALDSDSPDLGRDALGRALQLAPEGERLHRALAIEALNAGLKMDTGALSDSDRVLAEDPLVDYPWIHYQALNAAKGGLVDEAQRAAERIWSWTVRFGGMTPLGKAVSAEVEATWAGALWLRRPIRLQLGAQLLNGEASHPGQWSYGVVMWALGGGNNPERLFRLAEPHLDQPAVDFIVRNLFSADWGVAPPYRAVALANEAWDCMSDDTLRWVLDRFKPQLGEHPFLEAVRQFWAVFAARLPQEWMGRFREQSGDVQAALLAVLGTATAARLSEDDKRVVLARLLDALRSQERPDHQLLRLALQVAPPAARGELSELLSARGTPDVIAALAADVGAEHVSPAALRRARQELFRSVTEADREAREGQVSFGSRDARLDLARLLTVLPEDPEALELLSRIAGDPGLPGEHILSARNGLALLRHAGKLSDTEVSAWHDASDPAGTIPEHGGVTGELVAARRLQILATQLTEEESIRVISGTRSTDRRVRLVSIAVCSEAAQAAPDTDMRGAFIWALVGALFDPSDEVVAAAIRAFRAALTSATSTAAKVALARLPRLYDIGSTDVREAVAEIAVQLDGDAPAPLKDLLTRAAEDKSWRVRQAAVTRF